MKNFTYILFLITVLSCSSSQPLSIQHIEGKYIWNEYYGVIETIKFDSDSTFIFNWTQGLMSGETTGTVKFNKSSITLHSEYTPETHRFNIIIPHQIQQDYYEIQVTDKNSNGLVGAHCIAYYDGNIIHGSPTDEVGICRLPLSKVDSISISSIGFSEAGFKIIQSTSPKIFLVELVEGDPYHYFEGNRAKFLSNSTLKLNTFRSNKIFRRSEN